MLFRRAHNYLWLGLFVLMWYLFRGKGGSREKELKSVPIRYKHDITEKLKQLLHSPIHQEYRDVKRFLDESGSFPWHLYDEHSLFYPSWEFVKEEAMLNSSTQGSIRHPVAGVKNPCWMSDRAPSHTGVLCLPYFYLAGVTKSGTSDLYSLLSQHRKVKGVTIKEPVYWHIRGKQNNSRGTLEYYLKHFLNLADKIGEELKNSSATDDSVLSTVIGDGCPQLLTRLTFWENIPGNKGLEEPRYTTPLSILALQPYAKVIFILRDPVQRALSHYEAFPPNKKNTSSLNFHDTTHRLISEFNDCMQKNTMRRCAYISDSADDLVEQTLTTGLYHIYLRDWLALFPTEQIMIIKAEEYYGDRWNVLQNIAKFLSLDDYSDEFREVLYSRKVRNKGLRRTPMLPETKLLLEEFYSHHNEALSSFLTGHGFAWTDW